MKNEMRFVAFMLYFILKYSNIYWFIFLQLQMPFACTADEDLLSDISYVTVSFLTII